MTRTTDTASRRFFGFADIRRAVTSPQVRAQILKFASSAIAVGGISAVLLLDPHPRWVWLLASVTLAVATLVMETAIANDDDASLPPPWPSDRTWRRNRDVGLPDAVPACRGRYSRGPIGRQLSRHGLLLVALGAAAIGIYFASSGWCCDVVWVASGWCFLAAVVGRVLDEAAASAFTKCPDGSGWALRSPVELVAPYVGRVPRTARVTWLWRRYRCVHLGAVVGAGALCVAAAANGPALARVAATLGVVAVGFVAYSGISFVAGVGWRFWTNVEAFLPLARQRPILLESLPFTYTELASLTGNGHRPFTGGPVIELCLN